jgi:glycogen operon protein
VFRRRRFFQGHPLRGTSTGHELPDVGWFRNDGEQMTDADWEVGYAKSLGVFLNGDAIPDPDVHGRPIVDDSFYLLFNGWDQEIDFTLPPGRWAWSWDVVLDTGDRRAGQADAARPRRPAGGVIRVPGPRLLVLQAVAAPDDQD